MFEYRLSFCSCEYIVVLCMPSRSSIVLIVANMVDVAHTVCSIPTYLGRPCCDDTFR